ncbi:MAG: DNA-directed RNA polymerase subunit K [Halobacteria archaeon]|nr:DNA-directed RNA polymerase subunit K [Halobacteria archaeon]
MSTQHMRYTRYERARIIGARALQISQGAPPLIDIDTNNPVHIAREEFESGVLPITVRRKET